MHEAGRSAVLAIGAPARVAHHPVVVVPPVTALLDLWLVDAEEVCESVVALGLIKVSIELGVLSWRRRRRRRKLGYRKLLSFRCCPLYHVSGITKCRRLAARRQTCFDQKVQVVGIVIAGTGEEVVAIAGATPWADPQRVPE